MMSQKAALSAVFSPALANTASGASISKAKVRLSSPVKYYVPSGNFDRDSALDVALACALACTSTEAPADHWKSLIATYTNALFEGIVSRLPKDQFVAVKIPQESMTRLRSIFQALDKEADETVSEAGLGPGAYADFTLPWDLPKPSPECNGGWTNYCRDLKELFSHYALVVFLAGKQINESNRAAVTVARPAALIKKFKIEATEILVGHTRISDYAHLQLNQAWLEMSSLKAECFREFSTYAHSSTSLGQDILLTNINLMRFSQMQHAAIIHKFILTYPWASTFPALRQSMSVYYDSINAALQVESHLQPFIKVIWGDKSGIFPRKELGPLIAVALDTEKEVHETLANYYSDERFISIVEAFREERTRRAALAPRFAPAVSVAASLDGNSEQGDDDDHSVRSGDHPDEEETAPAVQEE